MREKTDGILILGTVPISQFARWRVSKIGSYFYVMEETTNREGKWVVAKSKKGHPWMFRLSSIEPFADLFDYLCSVVKDNRSVSGNAPSVGPDEDIPF